MTKHLSKTWKQALWKGINVVSSITLIVNMTMVGVFIAPKAASATTPSQVPNPPLNQSCGLDIALVLDNSQSITHDQRAQMKSALTAFTAALAGTPTQFSVIKFGNSATLLQGFTSNLTAINNAINSLPADPTGEYTNWEAGLNTAAATFPNRANPDLVIIATDGDPTASTAGPNGPVNETGYQLHLPPAISVANAIKTAGRRIMALGIGSSPTLSRLEAISGPNVNTGNVLTSDVITTNFANLANDLATFARQTCGGTITVHKLIDTDGNLQTTNDRTNGIGWQFNIGGHNETTAADGKTNAVHVDAGNYAVSETVQPNFNLLNATCSTGGTLNGNTVSGIPVGNESIVDCTFINSLATYQLRVKKNVDLNGDGDVNDPGEYHVTNWTWDVDGGNQNYLTDYTWHTFTAGSHTINEDQQPGFRVVDLICDNGQSFIGTESATINLNQNTTCVFTNTRDTGDLLIKKFNDLNGNGSWNDGELLLSGWHFVVTDHTTGAIVASGDTNDTGRLTINGLPTGYYDVTETLQDGWINTTPLTQLVHVGVNDHPMIVAFGNFQKISISGTKFNDHNTNGVKDTTDEGLAGWTIFIDTNGNGTLDTSEVSTSTDTNGHYSFTNLGPGTYKIREVQQAGWAQSTTNPADIHATSGTNVSDINFGNYQLGKIDVCKYNDLNGNGAKDENEPYLAGWNMILSQNNQDISSQLTHQDGCATFTGLAYGTYQVREDIQTGWTQTQPGNNSSTIDVTSPRVEVRKFGNFHNISVTVCKYIDANGDHDIANDPRYTAGWPISLNDNAQTTGENGCYTYSNIGPGSYTFTEGGKTGWMQTYPLSGSYSFSAVSGQNQTFNFGNYQYGKIEGYKFEDTNGNGQYDAGIDQPLPNWTINLAGPVSGTTTTDLLGHYEFDNLTAGDYTVSENLPGGWWPYFGVQYNFTVTSGYSHEFDFLNYQLGKISGHKYEDLNGNGTKDNGEPGVSGWTINLNGDQQSVTTGANGYYEFNGLMPGTYTVSEEMQTGWTSTTPATISNLVIGNSGTQLQNNDFLNIHTPLLTIIKRVINDNGGNAMAGDFTDDIVITATNASTPSYSGSGSELSATITIGAGAYSVDENPVTGYAKSLSGDCSGMVQSGDHKTCTIINDDQTAHLILEKRLINDNGGTATAQDWTLTATGPTSIANYGYVESDVNAGTYTLAENGPAGYSTTGWACQGGTQINNQITLGLGESAHCTITNDDDTPHLTLTKEVINDNGGTATAQDWTLTATGPTTVSGTTPVTSDTNFTAGTYILSESGPNGYVASNWNCDGGRLDGNTVTIGLGESVYCSITNNDTPPTLTIDKWNNEEIAHGGDGIALANETINYRIDWSVSSDSVKAANVVITDTLPAELTLNTASINSSIPAYSMTWNPSTRQITWVLGDQQPGTVGFVTYSATVLSAIPNGTPINNIARISADNTDPQFKEDHSVVTVTSAPVLTITKSVTPQETTAGSQVTYTVIIANTGSDTAINVKMTDLLPAGFTFADFGTSTHTFSLGNLSVGAQTTVTYKVNIGSSVTPGYYDNLAVASADNYGNVTAKATVKIGVVKGEEFPKLQIVKSVNKTFINPGGTATYTIKITNIGEAAAINVQLQDVLPAGFTFENKDVTKTWSLGDLAVGASIEVSYIALSNTSITAGTYRNLAVTWADNSEKVTDSVPLEVRTVKVLGAELPETGATPLAYVYFVTAGAILLFSLYMLKMTFSRED